VVRAVAEIRAVAPSVRSSGIPDTGEPRHWPPQTARTGPWTVGELYVRHEYWFAATQLILAMFGMGATLTAKDFKDVLREPRAVGAGTALQLLLVPAIAWAFISMTGVAGGVAAGLALIAAIPGGTMSNIFTYMARGNVPLSIAMTGITTLACLVTTPVILGLLITDYLPAGFEMPAERIISGIAYTLLLPLLLGMALLRLLPAHAPRVSRWSIRAALFVILLIVIGSASAGRLDLAAFGWGNVAQVLLFLLVLAVAGWLAPRLLGFSRTDSTAIEMELVVRNVNLGVLLKASIFPVVPGGNNALGDLVLLSVLLYGGVQLLAAALLIPLRRRSAAVPDSGR
jgi:BASS family bile acid:Na+ symporter